MLHTIAYSPIVKSKTNKTIIEKYFNFCDSKMDNPLVWYLIPLMTLPAVFTPIAVVILYYLNLPYIWFMSASVLIFYTNIIVNIYGLNTRVTISTYLVSVAIHILVPIISRLVTL